MRPNTLIVAMFTACLALPGPARAQATPPQPSAEAPAQPNNYGDDKTWLCRPGRPSHSLSETVEVGPLGLGVTHRG